MYHYSFRPCKGRFRCTVEEDRNRDCGTYRCCQDYVSNSKVAFVCAFEPGNSDESKRCRTKETEGQRARGIENGNRNGEPYTYYIISPSSVKRKIVSLKDLTIKQYCGILEMKVGYNGRIK